MAKRKITETELEQMYDESLNFDGTVKIQGMEYDVARVLKLVDPIAYRCGMNDYADYLCYDYIVEGYNDEEEEE